MDVMFAVSAVHNAKKVVEALQTLRGLERKVNDPALQEFTELWLHVEAFAPVLRLLLKLQRRAATMPVVEPAVRLSRRTLQALEEFLASEDPLDERPADAASWLRWLGDRKNGMEKKARLPEMVALLQRTVATASLALQAAAATGPVDLRAPFTAPDDETEELAEHIITELRTGRINAGGGKVLAAGRVWRRVGGGSWHAEARGVMVLCPNAEPETAPWEAVVRPAPENDVLGDADRAEAFEVQLPLDAATTGQRHWGTSLRKEAGFETQRLERDALVYTFGHAGQQLLRLEFEAVDSTGAEGADACITAELFECLLHKLCSREYAAAADVEPWLFQN